MLFFVISASLWFLSKLSQNYESQIAIPIRYTHTPESILKESIAHDSIYIDLKTNGYQLLKLKLINLKLPVDYQKNNLHHKKEWKTENYRNTINNLIGKDIEILNIQPRTIKFKTSDIRNKKVKILPIININYKPGYKNKNKLRLSEDSIWIFGTKETLDSITQIKTEKIELKDVYRNVSGELKLIMPKNTKSKLRKIKYKLKVEPYINDAYQVNYTLINAPKNIELILFPKKSTVTYKIFKSDYQLFNKNGIIVELDYNQRDSVLYPKLIINQNKIFDIKITPKKVAYLIKTKQ